MPRDRSLSPYSKRRVSRDADYFKARWAIIKMLLCHVDALKITNVGISFTAIENLLMYSLIGARFSRFLCVEVRGGVKA